ncbi:hypothetical protein QGN29_02025 [Temperatibacter marinus]|uniref:Uncharacterized protein n=1 Tax=Temperatibacter marinus TaxID=1456591 RepID=A0AA52HB02_9PROT|nr:hypothetical protein [Temperatibacter marinus]WND03143.1 hypothetical protein QGN29_02025 [Temperatibacter marinus]
MTLRKTHFWGGLLGLILFALSGQYMESVPTRYLDDGPRMMYRSMHIYFLFACLMNIIHGAQSFKALDIPLESGFEYCKSGLLFLIPFLFGYSFFIESSYDSLMRPLGSIGIYASLAVAGLFLIEHILTKLRGK